MGRAVDRRPYFARRLEFLREQKDPAVSQYRLAMLADLSRQAISQFELGLRAPAWDAVQRIAAALDLATDDFRDPAIIKQDVGEPRKPGRPVKRG